MLSWLRKGLCGRGLLGGTMAFLFLLAMKGSGPAHKEHQAPSPAVAIEEKLGQTPPLELTLFDEEGKPVSLKELIRVPTLLTPVYYSCPDVCSFLLYNLTGALNNLSADPGKEYQVITFSFDETETPALAMEKKRFYLKMMNPSFPEGAWRFLTADRQTISALTEGIGFHFKREGAVFQHPVAIVVLSSQGKIIRYLYGTDLLPFDIKMGLLEASEGRVGPPISKVLRFCFSYDPKGRKYVFNTLKVTGIVTVLFALLFVLFIFRRGKKRGGVEG